jgi:hypothetical protein
MASSSSGTPLSPRCLNRNDGGGGCSGAAIRKGKIDEVVRHARLDVTAGSLSSVGVGSAVPHVRRPHRASRMLADSLVPHIDVDVQARLSADFVMSSMPSHTAAPGPAAAVAARGGKRESTATATSVAESGDWMHPNKMFGRVDALTAQPPA